MSSSTDLVRASADLANRPDGGMLVLTIFDAPPGYVIKEVKGLVRGNTIRARHLGNDIVVVVFVDGTTPYKPDTIKSEFNHVFIIVQAAPPAPGSNVPRYRVATAAKHGVRPFKPVLADPSIYEHGAAFCELLLCKLINAERVSYSAPAFEEKIRRTRRTLLQAAVDDVILAQEKKTTK